MQKSDKHSILIVADSYGKPGYAPRLRSICDHLTKEGWQVEVYTERFFDLTFSHSYPIHEIDIYRNHGWDWALKTLWSLLTDWKNRYFSRRLLAEISEKDFDLVFCTTFSTFPLRAAMDAAKAKQIPLHVDLRDIDEQAPDNQYQAHRSWWAKPFRKLYSRINIHRRNRVIKAANQVTTISPWHVGFLKQLNQNTSLIYNGYNQDLFQPRDTPTEQFRLLYTGRIYEHALQDPTMLFMTLSLLPKTAEWKSVWYTDKKGQNIINNLAKQYDVIDHIELHDYVPTEQIPALLNRCSIAIVISRKASQDGPHGIMTTKFFEALGVEKPVLCIPSDEECLAQVILETNAGLAAINPQQAAEFILDKYAEWKANGFTRQQVNKEKQVLFSRQYQAAQFEKLFLSLI